MAKDKAIPTAKLFDWTKDAYPDHSITLPKNGIVVHCFVGGNTKKTIKQATFENKSGLFFGSVLNGVLAKLPFMVHHAKSNVYKVTLPTLTAKQFVQVGDAMGKVLDGSPKVQPRAWLVRKGLAKGASKPKAKDAPKDAPVQPTNPVDKDDGIPTVPNATD
jgi:hypothetical protein